MDEDPLDGASEHALVTLRILLLDEHQMLVEALAARLSTEPDLWVSGRNISACHGLVASARRTWPDVIVVEIAPLDAARRDLLEQLRRRVPDAHLVVLTATADPALALEAARLGAEGWVSKEATAQELVAVIRAAGRGRAWYPPEQFGAVLAGLREDARRAQARGPLDALTGREHDVLAAMVDGQSVATIAERLRVSANTVRTHVSSIYDKLAVHSRLEAVVVARAAGLGSGGLGGGGLRSGTRPVPVPS